MFPVIVCIAKGERDYIEEFIQYHLALGFKYIYVYDNEDIPTYGTILSKYKNNILCIHLPGNNYVKGVQYIALDNFVNKHMCNPRITHVVHIDIDEFIVLKKHSNICDFIEEYIVDDCQGIGINWQFFGSSGKTEKTDEPVTTRFTRCGRYGDPHIKTLFKKDYFVKYNECHSITISRGHIKSTNGCTIVGPHNKNIDISIIQLNHYKSKTLQEFRCIRAHGHADIVKSKQVEEDIDSNFKVFNINDVEDLTAYNFYRTAVMGVTSI